MPQTLPKGQPGRTRNAHSDDDKSSASPQKKPRRRRFISKLMRSAAIAAGEEVLASGLAHDYGEDGGYITSRVPKMALYGAFVRTLLTHFLLRGWKLVFKGRTSPPASVVQILAAMLIVAPLQRIVHLLSIARFAGARTYRNYLATVKSSLLHTMIFMWFAAPAAVTFAQLFLPEYAWLPFLRFVSFIVDAGSNSIAKKKRLEALRYYRTQDEEQMTEENDETDI